MIGGILPEAVTSIGVARLDREDLKDLEFDLILLVGDSPRGESFFASVLHEADALGIDKNKIISDRVVLVPNFTLEKYKKLRHSKLSILSMNCFGGFLYHRFGLPFLSPTINMFSEEREMLDFLKNPIENVNSEPEFIGTDFENNLKFDFPIYKIGDGVWNMNHYNDFDFAKQKWIERSKRINWFNLLVVAYTENYKFLAEFDKLPFAKKVCFVPFETNLDSGYFVNFNQISGIPDLGSAVNGIASGVLPLFDMWDMLLYGKKTPLT